MSNKHFEIPRALWRTQTPYDRANQLPRDRAIYHEETTPLCEKAFMSEDAFRVLIRSVAGGRKTGCAENEDGVQLYGWRIREKDGTTSAIITDVVESSPQSRRTSVTFDVDYEYAMHRDHYLRDKRNHKHFNLLGYIHSHPGNMTWFSGTDIETMSKYTTDMQVMLSGLVTIQKGRFNLTMYAATQRKDTRMDLWHLPLTVSDQEVERRMPACTPKPFEQVWCEATGTVGHPGAAPSFDHFMNEIAEPAAQCDCDREELLSRPTHTEPQSMRMRVDVGANLLRAQLQDMLEVPEELKHFAISASEQDEEAANGAAEQSADGMGLPKRCTHDMFWHVSHVIDAADAAEGEHGFLYGVIRDGELRMQMLPVPMDGVPALEYYSSEAAVHSADEQTRYWMNTSFTTGSFHQEGREWLPDPVKDDFGNIPIICPDVPAEGAEGGGDQP